MNASRTHNHRLLLAVFAGFANALSDRNLSYGLAYRFEACYVGKDPQMLDLGSRVPECNIKEKLLRIVEFCDASLASNGASPLDIATQAC